MSHTDPRLVIPLGLVFGLLGAYAAYDPEPFLGLRETGWPRTLQRVFGDRLGILVLRLCLLGVAGMMGWLVVHETVALLGG